MSFQDIVALARELLLAFVSISRTPVVRHGCSCVTEVLLFVFVSDFDQRAAKGWTIRICDWRTLGVLLMCFVIVLDDASSQFCFLARSIVEQTAYSEKVKEKKSERKISKHPAETTDDRYFSSLKKSQHAETTQIMIRRENPVTIDTAYLVTFYFFTFSPRAHNPGNYATRVF